jgi:hypothetical protein
MSGMAEVCEALSGSLLCLACLTVVLFSGAQPDKREVTATREPSNVSQPVSQEGTVVAATAGSVTARSADGYTQTYLVTPNTTVITHSGSQPASAATHFAVNDRILVVGTVQGGRRLATAVADRDSGPGNGPPMDYSVDQPIPRGAG